MSRLYDRAADRMFAPDPTPSHVGTRWDAYLDDYDRTPDASAYPEHDPNAGCWECNNTKYQTRPWVCPTCGTESCGRCGMGTNEGCQTCGTGEAP